MIMTTMLTFPFRPLFDISCYLIPVAGVKISVHWHVITLTFLTLRFDLFLGGIDDQIDDILDLGVAIPCQGLMGYRPEIVGKQRLCASSLLGFRCHDVCGP